MPATNTSKLSSCPCRLTIDDERAYCDLPDGHDGNHSAADPRVRAPSTPWADCRVIEWGFADMSHEDKERAMEAWEGVEDDGLPFYDAHIAAWLEQPADLETLLEQVLDYDAHVQAMRDMGPPAFVAEGGVCCDNCERSFCADTEEECQIDHSEGYEEAYPSLCPLCYARSNWEMTWSKAYREDVGRMLALTPAHSW